MSAVLVDSDVLLDVLTGDPRWSDWSAEQLARLADESFLAANPIISHRASSAPRAVRRGGPRTRATSGRPCSAALPDCQIRPIVA